MNSSKYKQQCQINKSRNVEQTSIDETIAKTISKMTAKSVQSASRDFGMADIVHSSAMERFAANMPVVAGLQLRGHARYPNISRWYSAMDSRSAYQKVKSDDTTLNLVIR